VSSPSPRAEDGFSMVVVLAVMMIGTMLAIAALSLTTGDQPELRKSLAVKQAYAAAEAGLHYYLFHLAQDNQYWAKCTTVAAPGPGQPNPVNQRWSGSGSDPRVWRTLPGDDSSYTIELLPVNGASSCDPANPALTMINTDTGMMRIRASGRAGAAKRSIIATLRRRSFIDYLYFTDFETSDPVTYTGNPYTAAEAQTNCVKYRAQRPSSCTVISFANNANVNDKINGPFHTNDDIIVCGSPTFGRRPGDVVEVSGPAPGWDNSCSNSNPIFLGTWQTAAKSLAMPPTNSSLSTLVAAAYKFTGTTTIRLSTANMTVTTGGTTTTKSYPANGLIYVKSGSCGTTIAPPVQDYSEPSGCANVYVSGTYSQNLTIASEKDIIIRPPVGDATANGDLKRSGDVMLGLIANNFIRVYHRVTRSGTPTPTSCTNSLPEMDDVTIEAAMLSLSHSFIVDNSACGNGLGTLTVTGSIAQRFRGPVGTLSPTGFSKAYTYDDRLRYREPPFFLVPVAAAWRIVRQNEQVPAR
jgi:Tfp pilus assembly protein PilX